MDCMHRMEVPKCIPLSNFLSLCIFSLYHRIPVAGEKIGLDGGFFLNEGRPMHPLALDHVILDLRLRPWSVAIMIDKLVMDIMTSHTAQGNQKTQGGAKPLPIIPETQVEVEPKLTCGALMLQVMFSTLYVYHF